MTQSVAPDPTELEMAIAPRQPAEPVGTLKLAIRRARFDNAEQAGARAELRAARLGRLEILQDALQPLVAQIPSDIDMFDIALVPSPDPRLFIDMIGFVETGRDSRNYILQQDTRYGRIRVAESDQVETMVDAVTDYVARRLLERDKALASDARAPTSSIDRERGHIEADRGGEATSVAAAKSASPAPSQVATTRQAKLQRWAGIGFAFLIDLLGAITFFMILGAIGWYAWSRMHAPM